MVLRRIAVGVFVVSSAVVSPAGPADVVSAVTSTFDIVGPVGSGRFGERITNLANGNFVVFDSTFDSVSQPDVGAVRLYDGATNQLISTLHGSSANDQIGNIGLFVVGGSNFLVRSPLWDNGAMTNAGALTFVNGTTGLNGPVSPANSLVGSSINDGVGGGTVSVLTGNGNFIVSTQGWDNGANVDAGAVTWASGSTGVSGVISAANSFVGQHAFDSTGFGTTVLSNGNYVIRMPGWDNGGLVDVGAATFANGLTGIVGTASAVNSLIGGLPGDGVGAGVTALTGNGNYVVRSPLWNNGGTPDVGAVTWASGTTGIAGVVSLANSLVGVTGSDQVGSGVTNLSNGHYVVRSPLWDNVAVVDAGAATWRNGTGNGFGTVSAANSIVGDTANDVVGASVSALQGTGNYLVRAPSWDNGAVVDAGAVTFVNGAGPAAFVVSPVNSLVGSTTGDAIGNIGLLTIPNGSYVVFSPSWNNGATPVVGAITWGNGATGVSGAVSVANSLIGAAANDAIGNGAGGTLTNGNVLFFSPTLDRGAIVDVGAVTLVNTSTGSAGVVGVGNSLIGSTLNDAVGSGSVTFLTNGNYVVGSPGWDNGALVDAGAITWGNGATGTAGAISAVNSVVGTRAMDRIGTSLTALTDGNTVAHSPMWDNGAIADAGASTWMTGFGPTTGAITSGNSLVGTRAMDSVGNGSALSLPDGDYLVRNLSWDNAAIADAGAFTYGDIGGLAGVPSASNSVLGGLAMAGATMTFASGYTGAGSVVVGRPSENIVTVLKIPFKPNFNSLPPARLADTRPGFTTVDGASAGTGLLGTGATLEVVVAGRGGVAANAVAVGLNVTAVDGVVGGFVTVFPCGEPRPTASNLNFDAGTIVPNAVFAKIGAGGKVCIFVSQQTHIIVDVSGYFPTTSRFSSLNPFRLMDTRGEPTSDGAQQGGGPVAHNSTIEVQVAGRAGLPANAGAAALNVTVTGPGLPGFATVFPCGETRPTASSLNYVAGLTVANLVVSKIGAGGKVCIYVQTATHVVVDINGYFPAVSSFSAINPARLLDTRAGQTTIDGQFNGIGRQNAGATITLRVAGRGGAPANVATVMLNVTVTEAANDGFITVFPCGIALPLASNLNYRVNQTVPNAVIVKVGTNGDVCIFTLQPTHLVTDITGYIPG